MTTLVGIKCEKGKKGVILASDLSTTHEEWQAQGDVAYRQQTQSDAQKLHVDKKREVALGMVGTIDQAYIDFVSAILEADIDIKNILENRFFPELKVLNELRWQGKVPDTKYMNSLLLAARYDGKIGLYTCWPMGLVEDHVSTSIGSGSRYALNCIGKQTELIPRGLSLRKGVDLVASSLDEAAQDIYTGGLGLVIVKKEGIKEFGDEIKTALNQAKKQTIRNIKRIL